MGKARSIKKLSIFKTPLILGSFVLINAIIISISTNIVTSAISEKRHELRLADTYAFCESLFDNESALLPQYSQVELSDCKSRLDELEQKNSASLEKTQILRAQISDAEEFLAWIQTAGEYIDESDIVKEAISEQDIIMLTEKRANLAKQYQNLTEEKFNYLKSEHEAMRAAEDAVNGLFTTSDREEARKNATRNEYNDAREKTEKLKQENLKNTLSESLDKVLKSIEEQERIAWERAEQARKAREEEQRKIANSWHRLDISPYYINQFSANIYNGCEAASLLMSLKYKGYLRGMDFHSFAMNMPKSDDPNQGFYLSMTDLEPKSEAHWIAPAPLSRYGASTSGAAVINVSGYSLDQLNNEIKNGNPVIIYLTYGYKNPKEYSKGVPRNLHVMVLAGYNEYTGEQIIYDPWPVSGGASVSLPKARVEYLYAASGRRAVVVR